MLIPHLNTLFTVIALLYYNGITNSQASWLSWLPWLDKDNACFFCPGSDRTRCEKNTSCFQRVYGPQLPDNGCPKYELLEPRNIEAIRKQIEQCTSNLPINCDSAKNSKYRTINGSCNNIKNPSWGMSNICLKRILPFDYGNNISTPRESCKGTLLPNARNVSNVLHNASKSYTKDGNFTTHFMQWGQMIGHDIALNDLYKTPESEFNFPVRCCKDGITPISDDQCIAIAPLPEDPFYSKYGVTCLDFSRTIPCRYCSGGQRIHSNKNTAYHDLSLLYGSTESDSENLRSHLDGMMKVDTEGCKKYGSMLPTVTVEDVCMSPPNEKSCFHSGDTRTNQHLFLLTVQTFLLRLHNFICQQLKKLKCPWNDETLYQEARRITIAIVQWITYRFYLPHILGEEIMREEGLHIPPGSCYTKYDSNMDPSVTDEFSVWAGRYGHTQIPDLISQIDPKTGNTDSVIMLSDYFFYPFEFRYGQYDQIAKGMTVDNPKTRDVTLSDAVRNYLYKMQNMTTGQDLAALSILRGRDHGIPGYTYYLCQLLNKTVHSFEDLRREGLMPNKSVDLLEDLYESVHDIDVYSGAFAEYKVSRDALVGPTIAAVLTKQYKSLKFGDRFWFEHGNETGSFTQNQLSWIKNYSLSRILCETTEITQIQQNPFLPKSPANPPILCSVIKNTDFSPWKECNKVCDQPCPMCSFKKQ